MAEGSGTQKSLLPHLDALTTLTARGRRARVWNRAVTSGKVVRALARIRPVVVHPANSAVLTRVSCRAHVEVLTEVSKVTRLTVTGVLLVSLKDADTVVLTRNGRAQVHLQKEIDPHQSVTKTEYHSPQIKTSLLGTSWIGARCIEER